MAYKLHHQHADEESGKSAAMVHSQPRRKGIGTRVWLVVSESGHTHIEEVGKHSIMRRTGLPARDLRVLDPMLSYPSTILGRERAIVINLEHIMAIITAKEVLMVNSTNPLVVQFVQDLQERVSCSKDTQQQVMFLLSNLSLLLDFHFRGNVDSFGGHFMMCVYMYQFEMVARASIVGKNCSFLG
ncbi:hypothetical protein CsSME_00002906 [Camellia sinensis var. sinensis]